MRFHFLIVPVAMSLVACGGEHSQAYQSPTDANPPVTQNAAPEPVASSSATPADNAARNAQDTSASLTPMDQGNSTEDIRITQEIRKGVMADGDLSTDAQNIKIITQNGHVVLRGPVKDAAESAAVYKIAVGVAGVQRVDNQTEPIAKSM
jgi:osmotically-inducible protein OsmY